MKQGITKVGQRATRLAAYSCDHVHAAARTKSKLNPFDSRASYSSLVQKMDDGGTPIGEDGQRIFDKPAEGGAAEEDDGWL